MTPEKLLPLKAVYSYYFPEVRSIIDRLTAAYPHDLLRFSNEVHQEPVK